MYRNKNDTSENTELKQAMLKLNTTSRAGCAVDL